MSATLFHPVTRRRTYGPHISVYYFQSARDQLSITDFLSVTGIDHGRSASDAWSPLPPLVDGGSSSTTSFAATVDGGSSSTTSFTATVDGGTSSDAQWSGILDVATRSLPIGSRTASDSFTISDVVPRIVHDARFASDSFTISDSAARGPLANPRIPSDSWAISDSATRTALSKARSSSDSFTVTDSTTKQSHWSRTTSDAFTIGENPTRLGWARTASDAFTIATDLAVVHPTVFVHGITYVSRFDQVGTQSAQLGTLFYIGNDVIVQNGEVVPISDAAVRGSDNLVKSSNDSVSVSDVAHRGYTRTTSDSVAITDSASGSVSRLYGSQIGMRTSELGYLFQVGNQY